MLREQARRLVRFSADAAALAQAEEAHTTIAPEWVDSGQLAGAVSAAVTDRYAAKGVALTTRVDDAPRLWGDSLRLGQVMANLLDTAVLLHAATKDAAVSTAAPITTGAFFFTAHPSVIKYRFVCKSSRWVQGCCSRSLKIS